MTGRIFSKSLVISHPYLASLVAKADGRKIQSTELLSLGLSFFPQLKNNNNRLLRAVLGLWISYAENTESPHLNLNLKPKKLTIIEKGAAEFMIPRIMNFCKAAVHCAFPPWL